MFLGVNLSDELIQTLVLFMCNAQKFFIKFFFQRDTGLVAVGNDNRDLTHYFFLRKESMETTVAGPLEAFFCGVSSASSSIVSAVDDGVRLISSLKLKLRPNLACGSAK